MNIPWRGCSWLERCRNGNRAWAVADRPGESAAMVMTPLISIGGAMVGGLWVPSAMLPKIVQTIGHFTPQYWAQQSLLNIFAHGSHIGGVIGSTAVLLLFGLVGLAVALLRLPGFMRSSTN